MLCCSIVTAIIKICLVSLMPVFMYYIIVYCIVSKSKYSIGIIVVFIYWYLLIPSISKDVVFDIFFVRTIN